MTEDTLKETQKEAPEERQNDNAEEEIIGIEDGMFAHVVFDGEDSVRFSFFVSPGEMSFARRIGMITKLILGIRFGMFGMNVSLRKIEESLLQKEKAS